MHGDEFEEEGRGLGTEVPTFAQEAFDVPLEFAVEAAHDGGGGDGDGGFFGAEKGVAGDAVPDEGIARIEERLDLGVGSGGGDD